MRTLLLLLLLGVVLYLGYRRATVYGWPWEAQVVVAYAEHSTRGRQSRQVYVEGELTNRTGVPGEALVECKVLPGGRTLSPKATATVQVPPRASAGFRTSTSSPVRPTGVDCHVTEWTTGRGLEDRWIDRVSDFFRRLL